MPNIRVTVVEFRDVQILDGEPLGWLIDRLTAAFDQIPPEHRDQTRISCEKSPDGSVWLAAYYSRAETPDEQGTRPKLGPEH